MKNLALILLFSWGLVQSNFAQGQVNFNNLNAIDDPSARINFGLFGEGVDMLIAQLFLVQDSQLFPLTPSTVAMRNAASIFVLQPVDIVLPLPSGTTGNFVYQVWDATYSSFYTALAAGGAFGESEVFANKVGGGSLPIENTILPGIVFIPEPSTLALGLLGAGALLLRRRK